MSTVSYTEPSRSRSSSQVTYEDVPDDEEEDDLNEEDLDDEDVMDDDEDDDFPSKPLNRNKLHRHDIISYKSMQSMRSSLEDVNSNSVPSSLADDVAKRKLSNKLSDHLHWKKKSNRARELRAELESAMESEEWISALSLCKKILDLQAFNFEPLYHFYCGFIYETGFHNYESAERHYRVALQLEQTNKKHIRYYARILRRLERYEQAEHVYEYGLDQHPDNHSIRYEYAYLLWINQKYQGALSQLKYCLDKDRRNTIHLDTITSSGHSLNHNHNTHSGHSGGGGGGHSTHNHNGSSHQQHGHNNNNNTNGNGMNGYYHGDHSMKKPKLFGRISGQSNTSTATSATTTTTATSDDGQEDEDDAHVIGENVYWLYGRISCELEEYRRASEYLKRSIEFKPDDVGYRVDYMLYLIHNKKYKDALKYYNVAYQLILDEYPEYDHDSKPFKAPYQDNFSYVYLQCVYGYLLSLMKKTNRAEQIFADLLQHSKNEFFEIHFYYGLHLFVTLKSYDAALKQFLSALVIEDNWAITHYYLALVLYELDEHHSALDFLNKAFKLNPSIPAIFKNFQSVMFRITKKLQREYGESEEDVHHFAVREYKKRNWSLACVLFLRLLDMNGENTNYQHNLAMVLYYGFENHESSEKYFRKSLKSCGSSHPDIIRHYNVLLIKQKRWEESHAYYEILFKIIDKYKAQREQQIKEEEKKYAKMLKYYNKHERNNPNAQLPVKKEIAQNPSMALTVNDHIDYATVCGDAGLRTYDVAKEHLKKALKMKPNDGHIIGKYAILLAQIRSYSLSKEYFKHSLTFIPKDLEIRYEFGQLLWKMQDYHGALQQLKKCLNLISAKNASGKELKPSTKLKNNENEEKCCILYGIILIEMEQYENAKHFVLKAIDLNSKNNQSIDPRYIAELMLLLIKTQQFDDAYNYYQIAVQYISDQKTYFNNIIDDWYLQSVYAMYCSATKQHAEAETLFMELIDAKENETSPSYHIHFYYGLHLHYECARFEEAKEQYIKAISIEDDWAITYWHYAVVLYELGCVKESETFIKKSIEMNQQLPIIADRFETQMELIQSAIAQKEREEKRAERERLYSRDRPAYEAQMAGYDEDEAHSEWKSRKRGSVDKEGRNRDSRNGHSNHYLHTPTNQFTDSQSHSPTPQPTQIQRNGNHKLSHLRDGGGRRRGGDRRSSSESENVRHRTERKRDKKKRKRRDTDFESEEESTKKRRHKTSKAKGARKRKSETKSRGTKKGSKKKKKKEKERESTNNHKPPRHINHQRTYSGSGSASKLLGTRRRSLNYGSHSKLLGDSGLDNLHKNIEREKKKKKKRKKKKKKDKLNRDANKMYNARYNKMYGIKPHSNSSPKRKEVREHQHRKESVRKSERIDKYSKSKNISKSTLSHSRNWEMSEDSTIATKSSHHQSHHDLMSHGLSPRKSPNVNNSSSSSRFHASGTLAESSRINGVSPYVSPRLSPRQSPRHSPRLHNTSNRPRSSRSARDNIGTTASSSSFRGHGARPRSSPRSKFQSDRDRDAKLSSFYLSNGSGISKINANATKIGGGGNNGVDQRSATPTTDASALFMKASQDIKRRKKHKPHKSFTNKNDFAEFEYKEKTDHRSYYSSNMQIGSRSGDIFAEFQEAAESLSRRKTKSKTTGKHSHSNSHSRHGHLHSTSHSNHFTPPPPANLDQEQKSSYPMYATNATMGPGTKRRSQKSQRSHRSQRSTSSQNVAIHREEYEEKLMEHDIDFEHKSNAISTMKMNAIEMMNGMDLRNGINGINAINTMNGHGPNSMATTTTTTTSTHNGHSTSSKKRRSTSSKKKKTKTPRGDNYESNNGYGATRESANNYDKTSSLSNNAMNASSAPRYEETKEDGAFESRYGGINSNMNNINNMNSNNNAKHSSSSYDYNVYTSNQEKRSSYDRYTIKSAVKKKRSSKSSKSKHQRSERPQIGKALKSGLHHSSSVASHHSASRNSTGSRNSFGSRASSAYNHNHHKNHHLTSNGGGAKSIKSNGSPRSITTRSITMVSASEEYSVDNATNLSGGLQSSYYDNDKSVDEEEVEPYSPKSGKSY